MATNELPYRFTETKYATRSEVQKDLKMSLIDGIWSNILSYRSNFNHYLLLKTVDGNRLLFCQCQSIMSKLNNVNGKLFNLLSDYSKLDIVHYELARFENYSLIRSLKSLAKKHDLDVDDAYLKQLIKGTITETRSSYLVLKRYYDALQIIKDTHYNAIDFDFIKQLYSIISGKPLSDVGFRTQNDKTIGNKSIIGYVYTSAPVENIDAMMSTLFVSLENSNIALLPQAIIAYYYINYIKPFDDYTDELALLVTKSILAHYNFNEFATVIPLEDLLCEEQDTISRIFFEVSKNHDVTYFINYALTFIDQVCNDLADQIILCKREALKEDFFKADEPVEEVKEKVEEVKPQVVEETKVIVPETKPVIEEPKAEPVQKETVKVEAKKEEIAISYIPPVLDEKQAGRLERCLLEQDPNLKKGEAKFYARHCTIGSYYTIAQYKKSIGCVYETARTSMEHLTSLGYYRKESIKNKFVYTPVDKR